MCLEGRELARLGTKLILVYISWPSGYPCVGRGGGAGVRSAGMLLALGPVQSSEVDESMAAPPVVGPGVCASAVAFMVVVCWQQEVARKKAGA